MSFDLQLINDDLSIAPNGDIRTVTDTPKLRQDILKIIVTALGSNKFHPWYGSSVGGDIIGQNLPDNIVEAEVAAAISQSLNRLKALQASQVSAQATTLSELIADLGPARVERNPADPRQLNVIITVLTKQLTKIEEVFTIIA